MENLDIAVKKQLFKKKMAFSVEADLFEEFNKYAKENRLNKSQTLNNLIRFFLENEKQKTKQQVA